LKPQGAQGPSQAGPAVKQIDDTRLLRQTPTLTDLMFRVVYRVLCLPTYLTPLRFKDLWSD
jgi:hypothetical protein